MAAIDSIDDEIERFWNGFYAQAKREPDSRADFKLVRHEIWAQNQAEAQEYLQPWLSVFELGLEWLANVHVALSDEPLLGPKESEFRVPWVLIGAASAFGWSLRQSCLTGFDTPARALLRTYVETLLLCLVTIFDKELAEKYQEADSDSKVVNFWHTHASPRNLHRRIMELERKLGLDAQTIADLTEWRREEYEVLSQSSHLSYLAAAMTCMPVSAQGDGVHRYGILGSASSNSKRTLGYAAKTTWYFSRLSFDGLFRRDSESTALVALDKEDSVHRTIVVGAETLNAMALRHWEQNGR
ncbi:hypothetical protein [Paraburkholderia caribensis]|uniref:hypothetical protein n=1 Tax=Paraburkholderia caribensis TaxID=75105 RepID=UPI0011DF0CC5|nr:hypothetical protein [Paraburkholderia caribensis]